MKKVGNGRWEAEKGMTFKRKQDGFIMGNRIQLGLNHLTNLKDVIDNYEEVIDENYNPNEDENQTYFI